MSKATCEENAELVKISHSLINCNSNVSCSFLQVVKGTGHIIYANTIFQCELFSRCMPACPSPYKPWLCGGDRCPLLLMVQNYNSIYFNNAQYNQSGQRCSCYNQHESTWAGGKSFGVFNGTYQQMVRKRRRVMGTAWMHAGTCDRQYWLDRAGFDNVVSKSSDRVDNFSCSLHSKEVLKFVKIGNV